MCQPFIMCQLIFFMFDSAGRFWKIILSFWHKIRSSCYWKLYHRYTCCLKTAIILICEHCFWSFWNCSSFWASSKNRTRTRTRTGTQDLWKNGLLGKTGPQVLKMLLLFSSNIKNNVEMIHFHKKRRCARPRFRANNVWKLHPKFLFLKRQIWYKKDNCQFAAVINMEIFCLLTHFYAASFSIKTRFYETSSVFLSQVLNAFSQNC